MTAIKAGQEPEQHLIHVEDVEVEIEHYPEDWLAFAVFWALGLIVFLQFFTRYVLNDSLAWTEEIARYGLMCVTFMGLLAYFSVMIVERMQVQRMTVIDLSMSYVYGAVAFGCFLMFARQLQRVWRNARDGWRSVQEALTAGLVTEPESAKQ